MAVEVDTDKYYFERILIVYNSSTFVIISALLARHVICSLKICNLVTSGSILRTDRDVVKCESAKARKCESEHV